MNNPSLATPDIRKQKYERGRAGAPPLSLRGCSVVCFCLFMPVICLLLMLLFLLLLFFFLLLSFLSVLLFSRLCLFRASP